MVVFGVIFPSDSIAQLFNGRWTTLDLVTFCIASTNHHGNGCRPWYGSCSLNNSSRAEAPAPEQLLVDAMPSVGKRRSIPTSYVRAMISRRREFCGLNSAAPPGCVTSLWACMAHSSLSLGDIGRSIQHTPPSLIDKEPQKRMENKSPSHDAIAARTMSLVVCANPLPRVLKLLRCVLHIYSYIVHTHSFSFSKFNGPPPPTKLDFSFFWLWNENSPCQTFFLPR